MDAATLEKLKERGFTDRGDYWAGPCPVHGGDNKTACTIYKDSKIWRCWTKGCHEKSPKAIWESLNIDRTIISTPVDSKKPVDIFSLPELFSKSEFKRRFCIPSPYMTQRGFSSKILQEFYVGACFNAKDYLTNRSVIPMILKDKIIGWSARAHSKNPKAKWVHSKGLPRSKYLYNMDKIDSSIVILTEGPLDCIKVSEAGYSSCVSLLGSVLSQGQIDILHNKKVEDVVLLFDNDDAGRKATTEATKKLKGQFNIIVPSISGNDPGDMSAEQIKKELQEWICD